MKPKPYVRLQAAALLLIVAIILGILGEEVALSLAISLSVGALIWIWFSARYHWLLLRSNRARSEHRRGRDTVMHLCLLVGLVLPCALAWFWGPLGVEIIEAPLHGGEAVVLSLSVLIVPLSILVSSSVDWYLIRPYREGAHDDPVCQPSAHISGRAMDYARYWVLHRMVSEFLAYAGIVGVIALASTIAGQATHSESGKNVLNLIGLLGVLGWSLVELGKLKAALEFVRYPTCGLGDWVTGRSDEGEEPRGFVLDVSTDPGVQLIDEPRGPDAEDISDYERSIPLKHRRTIKAIAPLRPTCPGLKCEFWVPDCEVGLREIEAGKATGDTREMEPDGIEPTTSALQTRRSAS
jgi:hypothetical protein